MSILFIAFKVLQPVLLASLAWAATRVADLINHNVKSEKLKRILLRLDDAIALAVKEMNQTIVDALRDMSPDGKLTAEQRANLKAQAVKLAKSHLGPRGVEEVCEILGIAHHEVDTHIGARVEAAVHDLKVGAATRVGVRLPAPTLAPAGELAGAQ